MEHFGRVPDMDRAVTKVMNVEMPMIIKVSAWEMM